MTDELDDEVGVSERELDAAVAERVMGWHVESVNYPHTDEYFDNWVDADGVGHYSVNKSADQWLPSEFIQHAMQVVEKMRKRGWKVILSNSTLNETWEAAMFHNSEGVTWQRVAAEGPLPEAICLAALQAVGEEEK